MARLLIDLDGVSTKTVEHWLSLYNRDYFDNLVPEDIKAFDLHLFVKPECGLAAYRYLDTPNFFYDLEPVEGVASALQELLEAGHDVIITTATPQRNGKTAYWDKVRWVKKHLPFFNTKNMVSTHRKDVVNGDVLLDDGAHNLVTFPGVSVAFDQPWNQGAVCDHRVKNWAEFVSLIKGLEL